jgi:ankyrin repeat protein
LFQENASLSEKDVFVLTKDCGNSFLRKVLDEFAVKTLPTSMKNFLIQDSCINQQKEIFDSLLLQLDNINCQDHGGKTALTHATEHSFLYAIDKLLEHKADAHITDGYGNNALHLALYQKKDLIAEKLIKFKEKYKVQ